MLLNIQFGFDKIWSKNNFVGQLILSHSLLLRIILGPQICGDMENNLVN
jgi:hypothetical protein